MQQPLWHVFVLSTLTLLGYLFYWFYKNWRDLAKQAEPENKESENAIAVFKDISPLLRTIGLFVPILNIYLYLTFVLGVAQLHPDEKSFPRQHSLLAAGLVIGTLIAFLFLSALPGAFYLLHLLACLPLIVVQHWLNAYWRSVEPADLAVRYAFTVKELIAIICGSAFLGLIVVRFMMGLQQ